MTQEAPQLRARAEAETTAFPPLLARAEQLAGTVLLGEHGRRRAGAGGNFWQYRPAQPGDMRRDIDWRRSAKSDTTFVQEQEWEIAQSVMLWVDQAASMRFSASSNTPEKSDRARLIALSLAILLIRSGERVGLSGAEGLSPRRGSPQIQHLAQLLCTESAADYGAPDVDMMLPASQAIFISDFLADFDSIEAALTQAADKGVRGVLLQILDPSEESFPFQGRAIFESVGKSVRHETLKASGLRTRYLDRLAERKDRLTHLARTTGWQYYGHTTDQSVDLALLTLYRALEPGK